MSTKQFSIIPADYQNEIRQVKRTSDAFRLFKFYLLIGYYLALCPFKVTFDADNDTYIFEKSSRPKLLLVTLRWAVKLATNVMSAVDTHRREFSSESISAKNYFLCIQAIFNLIRDITFVWMMCKCSSLLEKCLNLCRSSDVFYPHEPQKPNSPRQWVLRYMFLMIFVYFCIQMWTLFWPLDKKSMRYFTRFVRKGRQRFFLRDRSTYGNYKDATSLNVSCAIAEFVIKALSTTAFFYMETFNYGPATFILYSACCNFLDWVVSIEIEPSIVISKGDMWGGECKVGRIEKKIKTKYNQLKDVSDLVNKAWSGLMLIAVSSLCLRVVFNLNDTINEGSILLSVDYFCRIIFAAVSLTMSAEVYKKISCFRRWILEEKNQHHFLDKYKLAMMLKELKADPIGIGSAGMYKLGYGFLAQLLTLVITLFVISFEE